MIAECSSKGETQTLAGKLAQKIPVGSVVALIGNLGTGKTTFTQGFAKGLGITDTVGSPTFKLISEYDNNKINNPIKKQSKFTRPPKINKRSRQIRKK